MNSAADAIESLVQRAQNAEPEATLELLHRFEPLLRKGRRQLSQAFPHEDREILHSEIRYLFLSLIVEFESARRVPFTGYVERVLEGRISLYMRSRRRHDAMLSENAGDTGERNQCERNECEASGPHNPRLGIMKPLEEVDNLLCRLWWQMAAANLSQRQRQVMDLLLRGYTEEEVAGKLKIHKGSVEHFKRRSQKKLRKFWNEGVM